jgi:hypothetical protein
LVCKCSIEVGFRFFLSSQWDIGEQMINCQWLATTASALLQHVGSMEKKTRTNETKNSEGGVVLPPYMHMNVEWGEMDQLYKGEIVLCDSFLDLLPLPVIN